jgi:DNA modification methylase
MAERATQPKIQHRDLIESIPPGRLKPWPGNARTHSRKQLRQIAESIRTFGFTNPVLIDEDCHILAGHGRVVAAKMLGMETVPCRRLIDLSPSEKRAYVLADNKITLNAGWDDEVLATELQALLAMELDFDIDVTGFSVREIDQFIEDLASQEDGDPADEVLPEDGPQVSRLGDIWEMGPHRLICGDSLKQATFEKLLGKERAEMVFTDPPYNVPISGHVGGSGHVQHREFVMASGEMSLEEFAGFLETVFQRLAAFSVDGSIHYVCMDWRHMQQILAAGQAAYRELKNLIVWVKDNGGMGSFYRSKHELIFAFKNGSAPHLNNFGLGQHGRYRTNVWEYRGANSFHADRMEELALHPTVKPVAMIADAIKDVSRRGGIVLDAFGGSGSTLIAAHKTGRRARIIELDPAYVDRIVRRWQAYAKDDALLVGTDKPFDAISEIRAANGIEGDRHE